MTISRCAIISVEPTVPVNAKASTIPGVWQCNVGQWHATIGELNAKLSMQGVPFLRARGVATAMIADCIITDPDHRVWDGNKFTNIPSYRVLLDGDFHSTWESLVDAENAVRDYIALVRQYTPQHLAIMPEEDRKRWESSKPARTRAADQMALSGTARDDYINGRTQ